MPGGGVGRGLPARQRQTLAPAQGENRGGRPPPLPDRDTVWRRRARWGSTPDRPSGGRRRRRRPRETGRPPARRLAGLQTPCSRRVGGTPPGSAVLCPRKGNRDGGSRQRRRGDPSRNLSAPRTKAPSPARRASQPPTKVAAAGRERRRGRRMLETLHVKVACGSWKPERRRHSRME